MGFSVWLSGLAYGAPLEPPRVILSSEDEVRARAGEVVVEQADSDGVLLTASVYVEASPSAVMQAVMDLSPRVEEIDNLEGVELYAVGRNSAARWQLDATVKTVYYSVIYECDWSENFCSFGLDPNKKSDIEQADGAYRVVVDGAGCWLEYRSQTQPHPLMPAQIRKVKREQTTRQMLMGIKRRAETPS